MIFAFLLGCSLRSSFAATAAAAMFLVGGSAPHGALETGKSSGGSCQKVQVAKKTETSWCRLPGIVRQLVKMSAV